MAYFKPFINESGLHIPRYNEIKEHLLDEARGIFGQDIYLENDSQDYEFISLMADRIHDAFLTAQLVYNNRGPRTAVGEALDGLVKLNGLKRKQATKSTCVVTISGESGTEIVNGVIADKSNTNWDLETPVLIPDTGFFNALATCRKTGATQAEPGELSHIVTPIGGWISVTNTEAAIPGQSVEEQEVLRARQTISTAKPSLTILQGTIGGIAEILDVTRYRVYENDTNITDENTVPGHSICAVVEGGKDFDIANEIYLRKTPGCGTYGDVVVEIESGVVYGMPRVVPIRFFRPTYADMYVSINVKRLPGYTSQTTKNIQSAVSDYLNSLQIGEDLTLSSIWGAALSVMTTLTRPIFSILTVTAGESPGDQTDVDIPIPFNRVTRCEPGNVTVIVKD